MRRDRLDKQTLGQAMEKFPRDQPCDVRESFGVEDEDLQNVIDTIEDAQETPDGYLPHQCQNFTDKYPKLNVTKATPVHELEDFMDKTADENFLERIGNGMAVKIMKQGREHGQKANPGQI